MNPAILRKTLYAVSLAGVAALAGCQQNVAVETAGEPVAINEQRAPEHDVALLIKVKTALTTEPRLKPFALEVGVQGGIVTLYGEVATPEQRMMAERIARNISGVAVVRSGIAVTTPV